MKEREILSAQNSSPEITLRESLVGTKGRLSKQLTSVARMINYLDLSLLEKRQLFFYHLWHENLSLEPVKEFTEIKEDAISFVVDPVIKNDNLTKAYEEFYTRFEEKNKTKSRYQAKADEILPLRGFFTTAEISKKTGYSQDYIQSVFKRALKRGDVAPLDKKEVAKRDPQYVSYRRIREGVQKLRSIQESRYTEIEIAQILSNEFGEVVTTQQVKRQIRMLLRDGKITRRINHIK